jgi:hypothetical protein
MQRGLTSSGETLARLLADGDPAVVAALLADHVAREDGRCRGCRNSQAPMPTWPCTLRVLADRAAALVEKGEGP